VLIYLFLNSFLFFLSFLQNNFLKHLLVVVISYIYWYYFKQLFFIVKGESLRKINLPTFQVVFILNFFFFFSVVFAAISFLNFNLVPLLILSLLFIYTANLIYFKILGLNYSVSASAFVNIFVVILFSEIIWSLSFLPQKYYVISVIMLLCYYIFVNSIFLYLAGGKKGQIKQGVIWGILSLLAILLSAAWL
jgi:hypothetical protein